MLFCAVSLFSEEPVCKSKGAEVKVVYPDLARRMKIMGVVRLELQLSPSGSVRESKILGGNPILASAAQEAVKQARFEGAESCVVVFQFK
jgi:TonB family protein